MIGFHPTDTLRLFNRHAQRISGQASVECTFALLVLFALACPCVEFGRMAADSIAASSAATDLARAAASNRVSTPREQQAFLETAYPSIAPAARFTITTGLPQKNSYSHHFYTQNGEVRTRPSYTQCRTIETEVCVSRHYITPTGVLIAPFTGNTTQRYEIHASGSALRDETVEGGGW
ncbi:MAG: hypothetical protein RR955_02790 [Raoultibacter sp.]